MLTYLLCSTVLEFLHSKCQKSLYITTPLAFKSPDGDGDVARNRSMDRWIGKWCSYKFAAGSFHTKKLCSRLFSTEVEFYWHKQRYRVFVPPFGGLKGNVHGSSMARWKARGRLSIGDNWTFFASYHGWGAMSRYWSKFRCLKGGGLLWTQISGGKERPPPTIFGTRKLESLSYRMVKKIAEKFNRLSRVHQRYRQTDDRKTESRWQVANVNASSRPLKIAIFATPLAFKSPTEGVPWDDLRKIFIQCQRMAKVPDSEEKLPKISTGWVGCTNFTDRRQTERQTDGR